MTLEGKTTVLFDLDGTLLPMDEDAFTEKYFAELVKKAAPYGYEPKALVAAVWKGTKAMIKNDGTGKNHDRFWQVFADTLGQDVLKLEPVFDAFYANEFHRAKAATGENPLAKQAVEAAKAQGFDTILATNPLFPLVGVETRLSWVGLTLEDFSQVTAYEEYSYCKPNPGYFLEVLEKGRKKPGECLMVGNDVDEDLTAASAVGIDTFLTTDCLINDSGADLSGVETGTFAEMLDFLKG